MKTYQLLIYAIALFCYSCRFGGKPAQLDNVDTALKAIPSDIDTTIIVKDNAGKPLNFRQYIVTLLKNEGMIYREKETLRLQRFTKTGIDSLDKDDHAIARWDRWAAIRDKSPKPFNEVYKNIAAVFATADSVVVFKHARTMDLIKKGKRICRFRINLGSNPLGDKVSEGDWRTPEGVYYLDNKTIRGDKYYKSFWISYPDSADRAEALKRKVKPGIGVMIHGTSPERVNATDWTNGCIALNNKDMDTLFKYVMPGTLIDIKK